MIYPSKPFEEYFPKKGKYLRRTGEVRSPCVGDWFLQTSFAGAALALIDFENEPKEILEVVYE